MAHKVYGIATLSAVPTNPQREFTWALGQTKHADARRIPNLPMPAPVRLDLVTPPLKPPHEIDAPRCLTRGLVDYRART